jgi:putative YhgA-like transposase
MVERHDGGYRLLFSQPRMVEDLLRGFLQPEVSEAVGSMERRSEVYLSDRLEKREQDLVWRLRGARGEPLLYLLLEFQSEPDPQMAIRMSVYRGLLHQDLIRTREIPRSADPPSILAVVLYNGPERWIERPEAPYRLVNALRDPLPADPDNLAVLLFELERCRTPEALAGPIEKLGRLLAAPDAVDLRRAFHAFLRESLLPNRFPAARIPAILDLEEVRPMLRETVRGWTREWKDEGRREGRREGVANVLVRQLELKFGPLGPEDRARIDAADSDRLLQWGERVLTAASLEEVFGGS